MAEQNQRSSSVSFDANSGNVEVRKSKTLDSIASLNQLAPNEDDSSPIEFKRSGILLLAKSEEDDAGDLLCPGTLILCRKTLARVPTVQWIPDTISSEPETPKVGSFQDREWTMVNEALVRRSVRPIDFELCELKSFKLSDDGNRLTLIQRDGTNHPPLIFLDEGPEQLINVMRRHFCVKQSASDEQLFLLKDARVEALDQSLSHLNLFDKSNTDAVWKFVSDIKRDPYTTALSTFSKITDKLIFSYGDEDSRPDEEMADLIHKSLLPGSGLEVTTGQQECGDFEVVTSRPRLSENLPKVRRSEPLCQLDWELHWDASGKVSDVDILVDKIFRGGCDHNIRSEVWKYLLGYFDFDMTREEREAHRKLKVDEYFKMKLQWRSISDDQESRFSAFRDRKIQVEKDVLRTDRAHTFFEGDDNKNVDLLQDILMTYVMYNFDLGYVQGMSDLLAPLLYVMQNEVDAFWCFVGFMDRVKANFDFDQGGMKRQLSQLTDLLKTFDPEFYSYLDAKDSGNLYFCFRWLLIWFKREFTFAGTMRMWEVLWTRRPCPNFHLVVCLALMDMEKKTIMENGFGFTEILKHINDMAHSNILLADVLSRAEAIYLRLSQSQHVSNNARRVIGLPMLTEQDLQAKRTKNGSSSTQPMNIVNGDDRPRQRNQSSGNSGESLNNSSSVEVLSELDDEAKFENGLMAAGHF